MTPRTVAPHPKQATPATSYACAPATSAPATPAALSDPARLAALQATGLLDAPPSAVVDGLARVAARVLAVPVVLVSLVDVDRQFFTSCVGLPEPWATARETPLSQSLCKYVVALAAPLVIEDATQHRMVCDTPAVAALGVAAYAGMPLRTASGAVLGSFCAVDVRPRRWSDADLETLSDLAAAAAADIERRGAAALLSRREAELRGVLDHTEELVCTSGANGRLTYVNRAWQRALGYTEAEAIQLHPVHLVAPEDRARYRDAAWRVLNGATIRDFEATLLAKSGSRVRCRGWAVPQLMPGPDGRLVCVGTYAGYHDVTAATPRTPRPGPRSMGGVRPPSSASEQMHA